MAEDIEIDQEERGLCPIWGVASALCPQNSPALLTQKEFRVQDLGIIG
jgi:hypothetical protein